MILLKKEGNEPFIDYLKGISILCVIFLHTMPKLEYFGVNFWADMAVPIFLLIQVFHATKKGINFVHKPDKRKLFNRIILPYFVVQILLFSLLCVIKGDVFLVFKEFVYGGGGGPGSYYPWIYLQFAFFIPYIKNIVSCFGIKNLRIGMCVLICLCILHEIFCSIFNIPDFFYRLWFGRYLILIGLGYEIASRGIGMSKYRWILSIMSLFSLFIFSCKSMDLEPFFFNTEWNTHHWICFFYPAYVLLYFIKLLHAKLSKFKMTSIIEKIGKASYEIFLVQMLICSFSFIDLFHFNTIALNIAVILLTWSLCVLFGLYWNKAFNSYILKLK